MVDVFDDLMRDVDTLRRFNIAAGTYLYLHAANMLLKLDYMYMYDTQETCIRFNENLL